MQSAPARFGLVAIQRGIQVCRRDPARLQRVHLIFHQRDERRYHDGQPIAQQCRQLKTERLPAAGGHEHKHITPRERIVDDLLLQWPKLVVAEMSFEGSDQIHTGLSKSGGCPLPRIVCLSVFRKQCRT